jgi:hypothetical protein
MLLTVLIEAIQKKQEPLSMTVLSFFEVLKVFDRHIFDCNGCLILRQMIILRSVSRYS